MTASLPDAARAALEALRADEGGAGEVRRVSLEVTAAGRTELVTVTLKEGGALLVAATDGRQDGPHVRAALALLAGAYEAPTEQDEPGEEPSAKAPRAEHAEIADALDELLVAVVRMGVAEAYGAASVDEAIERLLGCVSPPVPVGIARFVGRLRTALADQDTPAVAQVLDGAARVVAELRGGEGGQEGARRLQAWLGRPGDLEGERETVFDRTLVEVAREWIAGTSRGSIQRRYMLCTTTGALYREDRGRTEPGSVGPCPRQVIAGLAEVEAGPVPRRLRLMQYAVSPRVTDALWDRTTQVAAPRYESLRPEFRSSLKAFPALAEPFAVVGVDELDVDRRLVMDGEGDALALSLEPAVAGRLGALAQECDGVRWIAGRLWDEDGVLAIEPFSVLFATGSGSLFERLL
ncbi:MAG TPA: hypothetical protein RMG95_20165 [Polyangiaceae bacterium LLY-WYZ-15_(1-7)]|nr:hypothetical protein [Polyangiaceae bacterium LLY-WYZ-15_(1-7)]HJL38022.1 hypothetical protein [Polyangiaceae bacterium LLY-WYZ-15_(1-7)]